jgi:RHS repeat-associated protein
VPETHPWSERGRTPRPTLLDSEFTDAVNNQAHMFEPGYGGTLQSIDPLVALARSVDDGTAPWGTSSTLLDSEFSDLINNQAREYEPGFGGYTAEDPRSSMEQFPCSNSLFGGLYAYASNAPATVDDPTGEDPVSDIYYWFTIINGIEHQLSLCNNPDVYRRRTATPRCISSDVGGSVECAGFNTSTDPFVAYRQCTGCCAGCCQSGPGSAPGSGFSDATCTSNCSQLCASHYHVYDSCRGR